MQSDNDFVISELQQKIDLLKSEYLKEKGISNELKKKVEELSASFNEKVSEVEALEVKLSTLKLAKSMTGNTSDMHDAKVKVTNLVREIDKCIAQLNR